MTECDIAGELIDGIVRSCPAYRPGSRPIHAPGIAAIGWFRASSVASGYTVAPHFTGDRVDVTVRYSNGTGDLDELDSVPSIRGMAVKFHLPPVEVDKNGVMQGKTDTDLVAMTLPTFFSRTVADFQEFLVAAIPAVPKQPSWLRRQITQLRLDTPPPSPLPGIPSNEPGIFEFALGHPDAGPAVVYMAEHWVPESYASCSYHAVHAFTLTGPDGAVRSCRFVWEPVNGVWSAPKGATGNFLRNGLNDWIIDGRAEFALRMQVAEQGDDPSDPTRAWPIRRPLIVMGRLRLTALVKDQFHGGDLLHFDPVPNVTGFGASDDPILAVRGEVYPESFRRRIHALDARATSVAPGNP